MLGKCLCDTVIILTFCAGTANFCWTSEKKTCWKEHYHVHHPTTSSGTAVLPSLFFLFPKGKSQISKESKQNKIELKRIGSPLARTSAVGKPRMDSVWADWLEFTQNNFLRRIFALGIWSCSKKVNGDGVINNPQHCKSVRCLHQKPWLFFTL